MPDTPALMLLSGGLDSVTALAWASSAGFNISGALSFTCGQRHAREIESAAVVAAHYGVPHQVVALTPISGSSLTDRGEIPQGRDLGMILIAYAAAHALLGDATHLIGGWNGADALNYPDRT